MSKPAVGDPMPDIAMETPDGGTVRPSDLRGRPAVIWFYPKDNTPGCTTEAKDFTALADDFAEAGVALLGVSKDPPKKHQGFIAKHALKEGLTIREVVLLRGHVESGKITEAQLDEALDVLRMTHP